MAKKEKGGPASVHPATNPAPTPSAPHPSPQPSASHPSPQPPTLPPVDIFAEQLKKLPPEVQQKLQEIKVKLDEFKTDVLGKFDEYVIGIGLLPPPRIDQNMAAEAWAQKNNIPVQQLTEKQKKDAFDETVKRVNEEVHALILIDDSDSTKMSKQELKDKLISIIDDMARKRSEKLIPTIIIVSELWQSCYDAKFDLLQLVAMAAPIYDKGMLAACKLGEIHKNMVLKKFEKYIVSYILFGSLTRGEAKPESDIDVAIIIDDTDVKKMTRAELKDKLRAIIIGMGIEASEMTGIKKQFNIQTYILTEFWDGIKEANPVFFTVLRDGVPFYDRGMFMPWKQLLRMGRIKPSQEAIDMFMSSGEQMVTRVKRRIKDLVEADIYWSTLTPAQAAIMLYGLPPPTPAETINLMEEVFVKKEKLLEKKYVDILRKIRQYYKDIEHGTTKEITGKEIDDLLSDSEDYLQRIKKLFGEIEIIKEREDMLHSYESVITVIRDILTLGGESHVPEQLIAPKFEKNLVQTGKVPERFLRLINELQAAKKDYDAKKLTKTEVDQARKTARELIRFLVELLQRERGKELERARIRVKYGEKFGEIILLEDIAFIIPDLDAPQREYQKTQITKEGTLGSVQKSTIEEFEKHLATAKFPRSVFIKEQLFEDLKKLFGKHVEVMVHRA